MTPGARARTAVYSSVFCRPVDRYWNVPLSTAMESDMLFMCDGVQ